jgi:hypothetical protein
MKGTIILLQELGKQRKRGNMTTAIETEIGIGNLENGNGNRTINCHQHDDATYHKALLSQLLLTEKCSGFH